MNLLADEACETAESLRDNSQTSIMVTHLDSGYHDPDRESTAYNFAISFSARLAQRLGHAIAVSIGSRQSLADSPSVNSVDGKVNYKSSILSKQMITYHCKPSRPTREPLELIRWT